MSAALRSRMVPRQILVQMRPIPRTLAESRLVLRELQKFGEVATFLNLKYDYRHNVQRQSRAVLAIFESEKSASDALAASPLIINLPTQQPLSITPSGEQSAADKPPGESALSPEPQPELSPSETSHDQGEKIICTIFPSEHHHDVHARENPYSRAFHISAYSLEVQDLVHRYGEGDEVRGGVPQVVLADCFARRKKTIPYRLQRQLTDENEGIGGNSPMRMWKVGQATREERYEDAKAILAQASDRYNRDRKVWHTKQVRDTDMQFKSESLEENGDDLDMLVDPSGKKDKKRRKV